MFSKEPVFKWFVRSVRCWDKISSYIDQAWGQDGWILAWLFLSFYWPRWMKTPKKERGQYSVIKTEQGCSIKDLLYGQNYNLSVAGPTRKNPRGQNGSILPVAKFHDFSFEDMTFLKCLNLSVFLRIYWLVRRIRQGEKKIKINKFTPRRKYCCHNLPAK